MRNHTFTLSDLDMLARHARYHGLHPPYLTADGRLAWLAFSSSSERVPLVPHPPRHPPPPPVPASPDLKLHVAKKSKEVVDVKSTKSQGTQTLVPTLTVTHGEGTSPAADGASKTYKPSEALRGTLHKALRGAIPEMRSALHEALRATEPRVYDAPWERWVALMGAEPGQADGGAEAAEQSSLRGKTLEF